MKFVNIFFAVILLSVIAIGVWPEKETVHPVWDTANDGPVVEDHEAGTWVITSSQGIWCDENDFECKKLQREIEERNRLRQINQHRMTRPHGMIGKMLY